MKKVAFICVHNSCRSQIAEALGKHFAYLYSMDRIKLLLVLFIILYFIGMAVWHAIMNKTDSVK